MTIPLVKEPEDLREEFGMLEDCYFCHKPTKWWHENTNNPVCPKCAKEHKVSELPDYGQNIRKRKAELRKI